MSDGRLLRLAEVLLDAFGSRLFLSTEEIRVLLDNDEALMSSCLDFLVDRDELALAAGRSPRFYRRKNVTIAVLEALANGGESRLPEDIARSLDVPVAITCEVLGWLEREGRVRAHHVGEDVYFDRV